jgi:hypothetical protein
MNQWSLNACEWKSKEGIDNRIRRNRRMGFGGSECFHFSEKCFFEIILVAFCCVSPAFCSKFSFIFKF